MTAEHSSPNVLPQEFDGLACMVLLEEQRRGQVGRTCARHLNVIVNDVAAEYERYSACHNACGGEGISGQTLMCIVGFFLQQFFEALVEDRPSLKGEQFSTCNQTVYRCC